jgi:tetratricopeptide (TPR) repeat protein
MAYIKKQGGVAQVVRACGSYPQCPEFKSLHRHFFKIAGEINPMKYAAFNFRKASSLSVLVITAIFVFAFGTTAIGAPEKKGKPAGSQKESGVINDSNLAANQKKVEELLKKNEYDTSLRISLKVHDYTKEVLATIKFIKGQYEKAVADPAVSTKDKEQLYLRLKTLNDLIPRYTAVYDSSLYNLGIIYAKRNESERARKYLSEYLQTIPFSANANSKWMKAKTLLLGLYSLEGEF